MKSASIEGYLLFIEVNRAEFAKKITLATKLLEHLPKVYVQGWCTRQDGIEIGLLGHYHEVLEWSFNYCVVEADEGRQQVHLEDGQCWRYVKLI